MKKLLILFIIVLTFFACSKDEIIDSSDTWEVLSDTLKLGGLSKSSIILATQLTGYPQFGAYIDYPIKVYKISYKTNFKGEEITASGVVSFPVTTEERPIILVGNGLAFADSQVVSSFNYPGSYTGFEFIAAIGYITFIPDLIGYGDSKEYPNIFYNKEYTASCVLDFVKAAKEFVAAKKLAVNGNNFIAGYSQGGYVTLTAMREIESGKIDFPLIAAAFGAGGFYLNDLMQYNFEKGVYPTPAHSAMMFYNYNEIYEWGRPMSDFFSQQYLPVIDEVLSGKYTREEADQFLTTDLYKLLNPDFIQDYLDGKEMELQNALIENSIEAWTTTTPIKLFHSNNDEIFPFSDTEKVMINMQKKGSQNISISTLTGDKHFTSAFDFMEKVMLWFDEINSSADQQR